MNQIMAAITKAKDLSKEDDNKNEEVIDDVTPTVEAMATLSVNEPLASPTEKSPKRRLSSTSRLIRQSNSISGKIYMYMYIVHCMYAFFDSLN